MVRCNLCHLEVSRGGPKSTKSSWNNKNLQRHLERKHPDAMQGVMESRELSLRGKVDPKDETVRGTIPLFTLDNHAKKKAFLSMVSTAYVQYIVIKCVVMHYFKLQSINTRLNTLLRYFLMALRWPVQRRNGGMKWIGGSWP